MITARFENVIAVNFRRWGNCLCERPCIEFTCKDCQWQRPVCMEAFQDECEGCYIERTHGKEI